MKRQLLELACIIGVLTFLGALLFQFVKSTPQAPEMQRVIVTGTPVELATQVILQQHDQNSLNHRAWQRVANLLLRDEHTYDRLVELDAALGDEPQRSIAATGYSAYYTGYSLLLLKADEEAKRCWEFGLASFETWSGTPRPRLNGNDILYHARTLMRLGRDEEAYEVLTALPEFGEVPDDPNMMLGIARTLGEIGHEEEATAMFRMSLAGQDLEGQARLIQAFVNGGRTWRTSFEPDAARMALSAAEEALLQILRAENTLRPWVHRASRDVIIVHKRAGLDQRKSVLRLAGEEAALRATENTQADQILVADAWWWVARYRALGGDPLGAAKAIRRITPGLVLVDELISDNDLAPYMDIPEVRSALSLHGDLVGWGSESTNEIN